MQKQAKAKGAIPLDRIKAVLAKDAPAKYVDVGARGKRASRNTVYKNATALLPLGERVPVIIRNLTATGCRVEYFQNRRLEGRLLLMEDSIPLRRWADVAWSENGASGLMFKADA